jgi:hypothetical protein
MKRPINYKPKYSLSIFYLSQIMPKKELDELIKRYVQAKVVGWKKTIREK